MAFLALQIRPQQQIVRHAGETGLNEAQAVGQGSRHQRQARDYRGYAVAAPAECAFEVIGVALDEAADREKLLHLVEREKLPWPQYFDGKKWKSDLAQKFSITSIPATLLLGPDGRLATNSARGPQLETEVKRLLNLP